MVTKRTLFFFSLLISWIGASTTLWGQTAGGFAYVANQSSDNVSAYTIDGNAQETGGFR
jgi:hypothetical protein